MHCGIDPGLCKTGWAVADSDLKLIVSGIVPTEELPVLLQWLLDRAAPPIPHHWLTEGNCSAAVRPIETLWCGKGTGSAAIFAFLKDKGFSVQAVDERGTTLEARQVYWSLHKPRGWRSFLPLSWQVPPRALDDLAAYCILRRGLTR